MDRALEIARAIEDGQSELFAAHSVERHIRSLDLSPPGTPYGQPGQDAEQTWKNVAESHGVEGLCAFKSLTLAKLITEFDRRMTGRRISESVRDLIAINFARILDDIEPGSSTGEFEGDAFLKDLGLCRTVLLPAGAQVIQEHHRLRRSLLFSGGVGQFFRFSWLLAFVTRGSGPFYQIHTHTRTVDDFSEGGFDRCYMRLAELLKLNPEVKGMYGTSWLYDPEAARISPRISYVLARPEQHGGSLFYVGPDKSGNALAKSKTRQRLHAAGEYTPQSYLMIWPRKQLLEWASRQ